MFDYVISAAATDFETIIFTYLDESPTETIRDQIEAGRAVWNEILTTPLAPVSFNGDPKGLEDW
jgi:hypothetical protein